MLIFGCVGVTQEVIDMNFHRFLFTLTRLLKYVSRPFLLGSDVGGERGLERKLGW